MNETISVIIPVYKVEKYLNKCVESIVNQTYRELEIILVDDGSTDNCPATCDAWGKRDQRIKVIHKQNGGLSSARNAGLDICTGNYVMFVDSDDYCDLNICATLLKALKENKADFSMCDAQLFDANHPVNPLLSQPCVKMYSGVDVIEQIYHTEIRYLMTAWGKLYKRELFETLRYPVGKLHEDEFIFAELLHRTNCFVYVSAGMYYYLQRQTGIMGTKSQKHIQDMYEAAVLRNEFLNEKYPQNIYKNTHLFLITVRFLYMKCGKNKDLKNKIFNSYKDCFNRIKKHDKKDWLFYHIKWLYVPLFKLKALLKYWRK